MTKLTLVRGVPGSGKSTYARGIQEAEPGTLHFEADQYFVGSDGVYRYDAGRIGAAHRWCQAETQRALDEGRSVVVSNTFTRRGELQPYLEMADELGVEVTIVHVDGGYQNIHGVPDEVVQRMRDRWQPVPGEIRVG